MHLVPSLQEQSSPKQRLVHFLLIVAIPAWDERGTSWLSRTTPLDVDLPPMTLPFFLSIYIYCFLFFQRIGWGGNGGMVALPCGIAVVWFGVWCGVAHLNRIMIIKEQNETKFKTRLLQSNQSWWSLEQV